MSRLPFTIEHIRTPPLKCQGIKTKLVPFIFQSLRWQATKEARWVEPFLGSGVVAFNLAPERALLADTNKHIIALYQAIQRGEMNRETTRDFLTSEGERLRQGGAEYFYEVRKRFNEIGSPFDFLFLNRSCFNGVMRFNRRGDFNVTKIVNQVGWVARQMCDKDWEFRAAPWDEVVAGVQPSDFVYLDPPYIGRHTDYFNSWDEAEAIKLSKMARSLPCGFALSMWLENRHRKNTHIGECWSGLEIKMIAHFYHVGSSENYRNEMNEAIVIKPGFATSDEDVQKLKQSVPHQALNASPALLPPR